MLIKKQKSWIWYLTFPFAHNNYTTIGNTIYFPKGRPPSHKIIAHEMIHQQQQLKVGKWKYLFLYLFCGPIFYNPWRYKWEMEAYTKSGTHPEWAHRIISSYKYGWLIRSK